MKPSLVQRAERPQPSAILVACTRMDSVAVIAVWTVATMDARLVTFRDPVLIYP